MSGDERIVRIESKIDVVKDAISEINVTLAAQHESLKVHIKRSDMLEAQMVPIKEHVAMVNGALKFIGLVAMMGAITEGVMSVLEYLRK